jgi:hypothetical protein
MVALISEGTVAYVEGISAEARRLETPCGDGSMVWRLWGNGPPLVLLHGGYGSWMHWIRNVLPLSRRFTVAAPDLPGLGESATPPEPHTAEGLAQIIADGLDAVFFHNIRACISPGFRSAGCSAAMSRLASAIWCRPSRSSDRTASAWSDSRLRSRDCRTARPRPRRLPLPAITSRR